MEISEETKGNAHIFRLAGRLDSNTSPEFEKKILGTIGNGSKQLIADFQNLDYISSAGLRVILKATKELKRSEGKLILCSMKDYVKEVFEISGFDTFLPIVPTLEDAIKEG